jgi:hypothetical protein
MQMELSEFRHLISRQIHVDRYKYQTFGRLSDAMLKAAITDDPTVGTRFHACERFARCEVAAERHGNVVYINPVVMSRTEWAAYLSEVTQQTDRKVFPLGLVNLISFALLQLYH